MSGEVLDEGLERLQPYAPEFGGFLSNHGPMVIETLHRMGRGDAISSWLDWYLPQLEPAWGGHPSLEADSWREGLGDNARYLAWQRLFSRAIEEGPWQDVVGLWSGRLAPGLSGSATHGVIRTSHAISALADRETAPRLRELADAMAYWAVSYSQLPEAAAQQKLSASDAIELVPSLPAAQQAQQGWAARVAVLPAFAEVADLVAFSADSSSELSHLTRIFTGIYLSNSHLPGRVIIPIHSVTCVTAVRRLLPYVSSETARRLLRYGWQAGAAIVASHASSRSPVTDDGDEEAGWDDIVDRAIVGRDEHAIKFTDALMTEDAIAPAALYQKAAADAVRRLSEA